MIYRSVESWIVRLERLLESTNQNPFHIDARINQIFEYDLGIREHLHIYSNKEWRAAVRIMNCRLILERKTNDAN